MDAARYTSAQAHLVYQTKSKESEANKIRALIDAGNKKSSPRQSVTVPSPRGTDIEIRKEDKENLSPLDETLDLAMGYSSSEDMPIRKKHRKRRSDMVRHWKSKCQILTDRYNHASSRFDATIEKERLYRRDLDRSFDTEIEMLREQNKNLNRLCQDLKRENRKLRSKIESMKSNFSFSNSESSPLRCLC